MRIIIHIGLLSFFIFGCAGTQVAKHEGVSNDAIEINKELRAAFRMAYKNAIEDHKAKLMSASPVITQDLLNMTLWKNGEREDRYRMNTEKYFLMAGTSHPPIAVYSILSKYSIDLLNEQAIGELNDYRKIIARMTAVISESPLTDKEQENVLLVLEGTDEFIRKIVLSRHTTLDEYKFYVAKVMPAIKDNLVVGAREQLNQFKNQIEFWRTKYPKEDWDNLRVIVMGIHQARDDYALKLFFNWLMREPSYERRVVFAEYQSSISGEDARTVAEQQAIELMTKVDFDLEASALILGHPAILQKDVMGPAAKEILESWGRNDH